ncbi:MAG TPA: tRNA uridine-5-carboxymethylaminomethyl(34) synthesis GTPase MnmE [Gemmatimonadales bacterium]|nr:tRNA uridine-5-carboxymethylaminomethyl(34) synthesis GTPase MnmE [Gemmatimonadales bacterium]
MMRQSLLSDPIVALATPAGRSALAVIRLSGRGAFEVAARVIPTFRAEPPREARLARFTDPKGELIDRGLYLVFVGPRSETGEDVVEFQCHGGLAVPARLLAAIEAAGARAARPGEFTRRAVLNGKLDLLQAEGLGDLVDAEVPAQARAALLQLEGGLSRRIARLRQGMVDLLALLAYDVDFPDEDEGPVSRERLEEARARVAGEIQRLLATAPLAERVKRGALVVLAGPPNAGKSSLFNALLGSERALVTELPGTTRDAIEAPADFQGWPIRLVDTAGLGEAADRIDALGQAMSRKYLDAADLVLLCHEGDGGVAAPVVPQEIGSRFLLVRTKADLGRSGSGLPVSALTGEGLDDLRQEVAEHLFRSGAALVDLEPALTRERHRVALASAATALAGAEPHLRGDGDAVLAAHYVQEAVRALDVLVGSVDIDEILDRVFASFCVGK